MTDLDKWILTLVRDGVYGVERDGSIWSLKRGRRLLKPWVCQKNGNRMLNWHHGGVQTTVLVHRLVALVHLPNPANLPNVVHRDRDKGHNAAANLKWASFVDSNITRPKVNPDQVRVIRHQLGAGVNPMRIALDFDVSLSCIDAIRRGETWSHI